MNAPLSPAILLDAVKREREYRAAESSLIEFTRASFPIIEPGSKFVDNWHLHAIAEHLEAVSEGEIENLVINIPPGCMKSILVSVAWPAWEWLQDPSLRYLGASYGIDLAIRDALKTHDIITSSWYQARWPTVQLKRGEDQKIKYALTGGGWRLSTSVGGRATGEHPDRKIVDDPHNAKQAESDAERASALVWFDRTLSSRGVSRGAKTVVVMQRLHESDVTGHILSKQLGYEHLCIPMEYERPKKVHVTKLGWKDPRSAEGSLLWPELFSAEKVAALKTALGEYGSAGQLQQRPSPLGGGILKVSHFQKWRGELPVFDYVLQSYDGAYTEDTQNDPTGCTVWGCFEHEGKRGAMLLDRWAEHMEYPKLRAKLIDDWRAAYGATDADPKTGKRARKGRRPDRALIEKKSSGISLLQDLKLANVLVAPYDPGRQDKVARAMTVAPILELDVLWIPESEKRPGEFVSWAEPFLDSLAKFPNAAHDEDVDTFTQAMIFLRDDGWFDLPVFEGDPIEEKDYHKEKRGPVYG